jgi:hypothetical protein
MKPYLDIQANLSTNLLMMQLVEALGLGSLDVTCTGDDTGGAAGR